MTTVSNEPVTQPVNPPAISYNSPGVPKSSRLNPRLITIAVVFAILVGYPTIMLVKNHLNGGISTDGDRTNVDLKMLGYFPFDKMNDTIAAVPPKFVALDGKKVALEGFVVPIDGANEFQFVYNVQKCCYGGPPLVQERVYGILHKNSDIASSVSMSPSEEVRCVGVLHVKVERDPVSHECKSLYTMDVQRVEPM